MSIRHGFTARRSFTVCLHVRQMPEPMEQTAHRNVYEKSVAVSQSGPV